MWFIWDMPKVTHSFVHEQNHDDNRIVDRIESNNDRNWWSQAVENIRINWLCFAPDSLRSHYNVGLLWIAQLLNNTNGVCKKTLQMFHVTRTFLPSHDDLGCATAALLRFPLLTNGFRRFIWLVCLNALLAQRSQHQQQPTDQTIKWNLLTASHESNAHPISSNKIEYVRWNNTRITFELHPYADR